MVKSFLFVLSEVWVPGLKRLLILLNFEPLLFYSGVGDVSFVILFCVRFSQRSDHHSSRGGTGLQVHGDHAAGCLQARQERLLWKGWFYSLASKCWQGSLKCDRNNVLCLQSDPFFEIHKAQEGAGFTVVYRSDPILKTLDPRYVCTPW